MSDPIRVLRVGDGPDAGGDAEGRLGRADERFRVETAASAADGLRALGDARFDCVVSGYDLPGVDGVEFLRRVREAHPDLPFVLAPREGGEVVAGEAVAAGVTEYVPSEGDRDSLLADRVEAAVTERRRERAAEAAPEYLRELTESTGDCLWVFDADWDDLLFVSGYEDVWNRPAEALRRNPRDFLDSVVPDHRDRVREAMSRLSDGQPVDIEYPIRRGDGEDPAWVWVKGRPVFEDGEVARVVGFTRDVTDRTERERELARYRQIVENVPVGVYRTTPDGEFVSGNEALASLWGADSPADLAETDVVDRYADPSDRERLVETVREEGRVDSDPVEMETLDGDRVWVEMKFALVEEDGQRYFDGILRDVTDRENRRRELESVRERIQFALDATDSVIYEVDPRSGDEVRHGPFERLYGISRSEAPTSEVFYERAVHPEDRDPLRELEAVESLAEGPDVIEFEYRTNPENGPLRWLRSEAHVSFDPDGDPERVIGLATDVTDRKRREQRLEQQNERLDEFANMVSHDLRNPLNLATGRLELARQECDSDHLADVADAHDRMETLITDLLTLAREGGQVADPEPVTLTSVVEECWQRVAPSSATLTVGSDGRIRADPNRLRQLLENLLRNATEHAGPEATVRVGALPDGFYVADDGPGIPVDERDSVFESGYTTADEGTGFGLAIVSEIADAHDWDVTVTDSETGGARFEVTDGEFAD